MDGTAYFWRCCVLLRTHNRAVRVRLVTPEEWRDRVGQHVEARRTRMFKSRRAAAEGSGVSEIVWRQVESGRRQLDADYIVAPNPNATTRGAIARRLKWPENALDELLAGRTPGELHHITGMDSGGASQESGNLVVVPADLHGRLGELTPEELARLDAYIDGLIEGRRRG